MFVNKISKKMKSFAFLCIAASVFAAAFNDQLAIGEDFKEFLRILTEIQVGETINLTQDANEISFLYTFAQNDHPRDLVLKNLPTDNHSRIEVYMSNKLMRPHSGQNHSKMIVCLMADNGTCIFPKDNITKENNIWIGVICQVNCSFALRLQYSENGGSSKNNTHITASNNKTQKNYVGYKNLPEGKPYNEEIRLILEVMPEESVELAQGPNEISFLYFNVHDKSAVGDLVVINYPSNNLTANTLYMSNQLLRPHAGQDRKKMIDCQNSEKCIFPKANMSQQDTILIGVVCHSNCSSKLQFQYLKSGSPSAQKEDKKAYVGYKNLPEGKPYNEEVRYIDEVKPEETIDIAQDPNEISFLFFNVHNKIAGGDLVVINHPSNNLTPNALYMSNQLLRPHAGQDSKKMIDCQRSGSEKCVFPKSNMSMQDTIWIGIVCHGGNKCSSKLQFHYKMPPPRPEHRRNDVTA
eukprot:TRINITY_DN3735_c0_g1_i1.p1 TRINITY_DN3735_c0_g1~~TRINITY_DN3735_c0_g1_i1.p1  ORF type:complete len:465 (+),score=102.91 TRINITY_DN3735_c0_g1_i1:24-1418(+)